ncbi:DUF4198 domain-containing protein, partial [Shinella sp. M27]|uniref:DUF4198 domain-containing protein n=1 Tax=Shinella sp. M27 TaxID=3368614 RepID=UPI003BA034AC
MLKQILAVSGALALVLSLPLTAGAHGAWVAERWGNLGVVYGHGAGDDPYDPARITQALAISEEGAATPVEIDKREKHAILKPEGEPAAILLTFDNGYWTEKTDGKWVNAAKDKVADAKAAGHYIKNSLSLLHAHGALPAFPKQDLQILPLDNPVGRKAGDPIRLRVLHDGKPLAGAVVTLDYVNQASLKSAPTDADGEVVVAIRNDG